jgi:hypothetical protein
MKTTKMFLYLAAMAGIGFFTACSDDDDDAPPTGTSVIELTGDLSTRTLSPGNQYLLKGQVFVRQGQVLTIQPGTIIKGDKVTRGTLIIDRGGRIEANGTLAQPIIFTSSLPAGIRDRGDWGGLVILGNAATNIADPGVEGISPPVRFGGNPNNQISSNVAIDDENSGTLRYVRVEFAGIELTPNNETNSITMGGVGRGTTMEYCQVSYGGDDGYEWFGGTINGKYLISFGTWDDDFDCDYGWSGNVQYGVVVRYPSFADQSGSNAFECDNGITDDGFEPLTTGTFSNITVFGPIKTGTSGGSANNQHCIDLRRFTASRITNSVLAGFPRGVRMNSNSVYNNFTTGTGVLFNNIIALTQPETGSGSANNFISGGNAFTGADLRAYWDNNSNQTFFGPASDDTHSSLGINPNLFFGSRLTNDYGSDPNFAVTTGTITSGASFSHPIFSEANRAGFFDVVSFRGAFGTTDWTDGWAEFDPIDASY